MSNQSPESLTRIPRGEFRIVEIKPPKCDTYGCGEVATDTLYWNGARVGNFCPKCCNDRIE